MFTKIHNVHVEIPYYRFTSLEPYATTLQHAVFTRSGGVSVKPFDTLNFRYGIGDPDSTVHNNRVIAQRFFEKEFLNDKRTTLISANQTHSDHIFALHQGEPLSKPKNDVRGDGILFADHQNSLIQNSQNILHDEHEVDDTDALITDRNDIILLLQVADCQPVILFDPKRKVLGMVHNGWRGCIKNILGKTIAVMTDEFGANPSDMIACIGPSIGPCCHYFTDPKSELPENFYQYIADDKRVNFVAAARDQLLKVGLKSPNIELSNVCTYERINEFFSYRRENRLTGRFGVMAALA